MKLKSYFTAALFVCLTLGLATSCKEKDPVKESFSLSKGEVKIGLRQTIRETALTVQPRATRR